MKIGAEMWTMGDRVSLWTVLTAKDESMMDGESEQHEVMAEYIYPDIFRKTARIAAGDLGFPSCWTQTQTSYKK